MRKIFIMAFAILVGSVYLKAQINHTVAGKPGSIYSTPGYNGDNILATSAELNGPGGVAVDGDGNVYIADASNYRVRKVDKNGIITTVVGTGVSGNIIQHYHPTLSQLGLPSDVAINAAGTHLYILDVSNNYVLMVDFSASPNSISIIAGGGISTNDGILATEANISNLGVFNIALDKSENLYISEGGAPSSTSSGMIRKVTYSNQIINTVANAATSGLNHPLGLAIDANYNIYVADYGTYEVKKITPSGSASVIAGNGTLGYSGDGGPATSAAFENPSEDRKSVV